MSEKVTDLALEWHAKRGNGETSRMARELLAYRRAEAAPTASGDDETCTCCRGTEYDPVREVSCHCSPAAPATPGAYAIGEEWAERMLPLDEGVTPSAVAPAAPATPASEDLREAVEDCDLATWRPGACGICGEHSFVTDPGNFGNLKPGWSAGLVNGEGEKMIEPRRAWLQFSGDALDRHDDKPFPGSAAYHNGDVVRDLVDAGTALVDRWDSPLWGGSSMNLKHTGDHIAELRAALVPFSEADGDADPRTRDDLRRENEKLRNVLAGLSSFLGAGLGDGSTTPEDYDARIRWGIEDQHDKAGPERVLTDKVLAELARSRVKFPGKSVTFAALVEEVGELATATFEESADRVGKEAVQVAVMAMRMILDGDSCFDNWRSEKGLDHLNPDLREDEGADGAPLPDQGGVGA